MAEFSIRTIYFKSNDIAAVCGFWAALLETSPHKDSERWKEIDCGNIRLGFLKLDGKQTGSNCVSVFEFANAELGGYVDRAIGLGATLLIDGRDDPNMLSVLLKDPFGNEFEFSKFHD